MSKELLPCPFCGGTNTQIREHTMWTGMKASILSVSIYHWCEEPGPSRIIERIGRDEQEAIKRWNMRSK